MTAGVGRVSRAIENIASISEENSAASEEVGASVEEVNAQMQEVTASAQSLSEMAQELQALVAQFTLSGNRADEKPGGRAIEVVEWVSAPRPTTPIPAIPPGGDGHRYGELDV